MLRIVLKINKFLTDCSFIIIEYLRPYFDMYEAHPQQNQHLPFF